MKKEWKKPFVKWVILNGVNVIATSQEIDGRGFQDEGEGWIQRGR